MAEDIGNIYKTKIPSYAEAADIQAALKLFHYGTTTVPTTEGEILADSLAGHLKALDTRLDTIESDPARSDFLTQAEMAVSFPTRVNGYISMDPNSNGGSVEELYASAIYSNEPPTVGLVNGLIWVDKDSPALDTYVYDSTSTPSPWVRINDIKKIVQSKGDLLVGSTSADVDNLSVGANGTVLTADDTQTLGVKWQAVSTYSQPTLGSTAIPSGSTISNVNGLTINSTTIPTSKTLVATDSYAYVIPSMSGNSGKYLTNNGDTPSWVTAPSAGGMTLLASGSCTSNIDLTSISQSYKNLQLVLRNISTTGGGSDNRIMMRFNNASGSNYAAISSLENNNKDFTSTELQISGSLGGSTSTRTNLFIVDIFDYTNTSTWKMIQSRGFLNNNTTTTNLNFYTMWGFYNSVSAITTINLLGWPSFSHTLNNGTYLLYGVS